MNTACKCFVCGAEYGSENPDDQAGDGRCKDCELKRKAVAFKVDIEIGERRRLNPIVRDQRSEMIQDVIKNGGHISARDLGIHPNG